MKSDAEYEAIKGRILEQIDALSDDMANKETLLTVEERDMMITLITAARVKAESNLFSDFLKLINEIDMILDRYVPRLQVESNNAS